MSRSREISILAPEEGEHNVTLAAATSDFYIRAPHFLLATAEAEAGADIAIAEHCHKRAP